MTLPDRKGYNPAEQVIFNHIDLSTLEWLCLIGVEQRSSYPQTRQSLAAAIKWDLKTNLLCEVGALGYPRPKGWSRPKQRHDWGIMTLAVDMRPLATLHIRVCGMETVSTCRPRTAVRVSFNLYPHSSGCAPRKPMMQSYYSIDYLEAVCTLCRRLSRLPNHMSVRCPCWSYDMIYDIVQVWADSYQYRKY
jgi:hypothetical protein